MVNDPHPQEKDPHPGPEATFTMWEMGIFLKRWDPHPLRSLSRFFKKVHFNPHCRITIVDLLWCRVRLCPHHAVHSRLKRRRAFGGRFGPIWIHLAFETYAGYGSLASGDCGYLSRLSRSSRVYWDRKEASGHSRACGTDSTGSQMGCVCCLTICLEAIFVFRQAVGC